MNQKVIIGIVTIIAFTVIGIRYMAKTDLVTLQTSMWGPGEAYYTTTFDSDDDMNNMQYMSPTEAYKALSSIGYNGNTDLINHDVEVRSFENFMRNKAKELQTYYKSAYPDGVVPLEDVLSELKKNEHTYFKEFMDLPLDAKYSYALGKDFTNISKVLNNVDKSYFGGKNDSLDTNPFWGLDTDWYDNPDLYMQALQNVTRSKPIDGVNTKAKNRNFQTFLRNEVANLKAKEEKEKEALEADNLDPTEANYKKKGTYEYDMENHPITGEDDTEPNLNDVTTAVNSRGNNGYPESRYVQQQSRRGYHQDPDRGWVRNRASHEDIDAYFRERRIASQR